MHGRSFEEVWKDILTIARQKKAKGEGIYTLPRKVPNEIWSVDPDGIEVVPQWSVSSLYKWQFQTHWDKLAAEGQVTLQQFKELPSSITSIIMAFIAHLPCVEYTTRPRTTLYLMPHDTHPLGTLRERGEEQGKRFSSLEGLWKDKAHFTYEEIQAAKIGLRTDI